MADGTLTPNLPLSLSLSLRLPLLYTTKTGRRTTSRTVRARGSPTIRCGRQTGASIPERERERERKKEQRGPTQAPVQLDVYTNPTSLPSRPFSALLPIQRPAVTTAANLSSSANIQKEAARTEKKQQEGPGKQTLAPRPGPFLFHLPLKPGQHAASTGHVGRRRRAG